MRPEGYSGAAAKRTVGSARSSSKGGAGAASRRASDLEFVEREATLQALRAAIEGGEPPETVAADNVKSLAAMLGCVGSIESGEPVDVAALLAARGR